MSNSRSFRRGLKAGRRVRPSGTESPQERPARQPWNKGLALTSTPSLSTSRRWLEVCVDKGWAERRAFPTGKPGRPPVMYRATAAGIAAAGETPPLKVQVEQARRLENLRKRHGMQRRARKEKALREKAFRAARKLGAATTALESATAALEQAKAGQLTAEIALLAVKALGDAGGDPSVLLSEEVDVLRETGCIGEEGRCPVVYEEAVERLFEGLAR